MREYLSFAKESIILRMDNEECVLFQDQVQQGTTMPIECTSQTDPGRNAVFADGVFSRESNHQRSCLIYDLLGVCCGKSVCFAAVEPRLESVQIDFVGAANVPESNNMDACIAKDEKASEPSPAVRHVVQQILGGCRHGDTGSKLLRWTSYQRCMGRCC